MIICVNSPQNHFCHCFLISDYLKNEEVSYSLPVERESCLYQFLLINWGCMQCNRFNHLQQAQSDCDTLQLRECSINVVLHAHQHNYLMREHPLKFYITHLVRDFVNLKPYAVEQEGRFRITNTSGEREHPHIHILQCCSHQHNW